MSVLRLFAKKDIPVVDRPIKAGQELRIGKISPSKTKFMVICMEDDLHKWMDMVDYDEYIEDKFVE